jgi:hypothetical protein
VALRLSHVLVLMALVLAAGVLSVQGLDEGVGAHVVQGTIVVSAPGLSLSGVQALVRDRPEARWTVLAADDAPLSPFDEGLVAACISRGVVASLFVQPQPPGAAAGGAGPARDWALDPARAAALRSAWRVLIAPETGDCLPSLLDFVAAQSGTRAFLAGLILPATGDDGEVDALLDALIAAADELPSYRRTTIVLLGQRQPGSGVRVSVRVDRGRSTLAAPVTLVDLLERDR